MDNPLTHNTRLPDGVLVDDADLPKVLQFKWHIDGKGYVISDTRHTIKGRRYGSMTLLHRCLLGLEKGDPIVDHINQDKLDNRRSNLRLADKSTNALNRGAQANSKTGYKGISWDKQKGKWRVAANLQGKQYHLGFYSNIEDAIQAWNDKIEDVHGEWAVKQ